MEWKLAKEAMWEYLKPIVRASRDVSRGRNDRGKFARAVEGLNAAMDGPLIGESPSVNESAATSDAAEGGAAS